jgi:hypothetical protein
VIDHYRDALEHILEEFVYYLSLDGVELLLREDERHLGGRLAEDVGNLVRLGPEEHLRLLGSDRDEEETSIILISLLWKQRLGMVSEDLRVALDFAEQQNAYLPHRYMAENGWPVEALSFKSISGGRRSYLRLDELLGGWSEDHGNVGALEAEIHLLLDLFTVLGPQIERLELRKLADTLAQTATARESILDGDDLYGYTTLVYDTGFPREEAWPAFRQLLASDQATWASAFPAWFLGAKMFGERIFEELGKRELPVPVEVLKELDRLCPWPSHPLAR